MKCLFIRLSVKHYSGYKLYAQTISFQIFLNITKTQTIFYI